MSSKVELLTIKEFADRVGVTAQSVYKRLSKVDNPIQPFVERIDNQLRIRETAIEVIYRKKVDNSTTQPSLNVVEKVETETEGRTTENNVISSASYERVIALLEGQIKAYQKENEEKTDIIKSLTERLAEQTQMLNQQQQLSAMDKKRILELEEGHTEGQPKRKGFFHFFNK